MDKDPTQTTALELDLSTDEWTQLLAEAPVYAKKGLVQLRPATPGEKIITTLADGTVETENIAGENDVIVTNPGGEQYIIDAEKAGKRYEPTDEDGVYRAKGMARAIVNPTGQPIEITAPWGEKQFGNPDCLVATVFDPDQPDEIGSDRYIIGADEFAETYGLAEEVLTTEA
ncbi:hypothetical protein KBD20_04885 [Candidatus Saccharibacteria bacterium]|nr:hypothetical protein [Candidatus Saccharibacteria bacterium]